MDIGKWHVPSGQMPPDYAKRILQQAAVKKDVRMDATANLNNVQSQVRWMQ